MPMFLKRVRHLRNLRGNRMQRHDGRGRRQETRDREGFRRRVESDEEQCPSRLVACSSVRIVRERV